MSGKLFFAGGGGAEQSHLFDKVLAESLPGKRIVYIPIAINEVKHPYPSCLDWFKSIFLKLGVKSENILMLTDLNSISYEELSSYDAVYIGGGNTFKLIKTMRDTGFDKLLLKFHRSGGIIYGGSAGAILMGADIKNCEREDKNEYDVQVTRGFDLLMGYSVWAHYKEGDEQKIKNYVKISGEKIIAIPESSGVMLDNHTLHIIGKEPVTIFDSGSKSELEPGTTKQL